MWVIKNQFGIADDDRVTPTDNVGKIQLVDTFGQRLGWEVYDGDWTEPPADCVALRSDLLFDDQATATAIRDEYLPHYGVTRDDFWNLANSVKRYNGHWIVSEAFYSRYVADIGEGR